MIKGTDIVNMKIVKRIPCSPSIVQVQYIKDDNVLRTAYVDFYTLIKGLNQFVFFEPSKVGEYLDINFAETDVMNGKGRG